MNKNLSLLITGDFYITPHYTNKNVFAKDVIECFKSSDFNVVNLESPVVENNDELKIKIFASKMKKGRAEINF